MTDTGCGHTRVVLRPRHGSAYDSWECAAGCGATFDLATSADRLRSRVQILEHERIATQESTRTLTCVFCGHAYPPNTPASNHQMLAAHVLVCPSHPAAAIRAELVGLATKTVDCLAVLGYRQGIVDQSRRGKDRNTDARVMVLLDHLAGVIHNYAEKAPSPSADRACPQCGQVWKTDAANLHPLRCFKCGWSRPGEHILHGSRGECHEEKCNICEGGLGLCTVCGGAEGSMPTSCPGIRMTGTQADAVFAGTMDYVGGRWIERENRGHIR